MIEQLLTTLNPQDTFLTNVAKQPTAANSADVMRFNMELSDNKPDMATKNHILQDVRVDTSRIDNNLLSMQRPPSVTNPLMKLDSSYRSIMNQMDDVPELDRFLEMKDNTKAHKVRTNVQESMTKDPGVLVKEMLAETRELYKTAGRYSKDITKWHIKTQIWSANIKILTTVVSQASRGLKTLFRSAG